VIKPAVAVAIKRAIPEAVAVNSATVVAVRPAAVPATVIKPIVAVAIKPAIAAAAITAATVVEAKPSAVPASDISPTVAVVVGRPISPLADPIQASKTTVKAPVDIMSNTPLLTGNNAIPNADFNFVYSGGQLKAVDSHGVSFPAKNPDAPTVSISAVTATDKVSAKQPTDTYAAPKFAFDYSGSSLNAPTTINLQLPTDTQSNPKTIDVTSTPSPALVSGNQTPLDQVANKNPVTRFTNIQAVSSMDFSSIFGFANTWPFQEFNTSAQGKATPKTYIFTFFM
jgi:hypothetical protein